MKSKFSFVSSITKISGKHLSITNLKSVILFRRLFIFKKPIKGLFGFFILRLKNSSISLVSFSSGEISRSDGHVNVELSVSELDENLVVSKGKNSGIGPFELENEISMLLIRL